jgi:hypothetical protein
MMLNKKNVILLISTILYISLIGFILPLVFISLDVNQSIYSYFDYLSDEGFFFLTYIVSTILFFPFIYSTLVKEKLSLSVRNIHKKRKNPRYYASVLFIIGIPITFWLIVGLVGYNSMYDHTPGLGEFANNGFLVLLFVLMYFCIIPALLLSAKKNKTRIQLNP